MTDGGQTIQRIVIIDDSEVDRGRVRAALVQGAPRRRFAFQEARNGEEGLLLCRTAEHGLADCVIVDIHMPQLGGIEMLKQLRDESGYPPCPVIVLTGNSTDSEAGAALKLGAQDYVSKNAISPELLPRVVDNAIERYGMMKRLRESERAADLANRAKSSLIGNISHELRTPMTAVQGLCDVLLDTDLNGNQRALLKMIRDNGLYLLEIVNDLLDLSKLEAGMMQIEHEPVILQKFVTDICSLMQIRARQNHTSLSVRVDENLPARIRSDPIRLRQILLNLISNAIKFTPGGNVSLEVGLCDHLNRDGETVCFDVIDNGCGIAEEHVDHIFEPFAQSDDNRRRQSQGGTGLGLSICKRLVAAMQGRLEVASRIDRGSRFTVLLPLLNAGDEPTAPESEPLELTGTVSELIAGRTFLVAEDTRATQVVLRRFIEAAGGTVTMVGDGEQLVRMHRDAAKSHDIIITDIQMPHADGLEATRRVREFDSTTPIVVLTADALPSTRHDALAAGANAILTKPIDRRALLELLAVMCAKA